MTTRDEAQPRGATAHAMLIFVNRRRLEVTEEALSGAQILAAAGLGQDYDLFLLQGEGDPTGGSPISLDQVVRIQPGMHFRAIPGNRNFGGEPR